MKKFFRWFFVILATIAATLLGLREIGGTPISRGYNTGFQWAPDPSHSRVMLTVEPEGDMVCWLRLRVPGSTSNLTAEISTGTPLTVLPQEKDGADQWFAVAKKSLVTQDKFEWSSGATIYLYSQNKQTPFEIKDWYVFPNNKDFDSKHRAKWRSLWFWISLVALALSALWAVIERVAKESKESSKTEPFSPQRCIEQLIASIDGKDAEESERMRWVLKKVLIEGTAVNDAIGTLPLKKREQQSLWFKTAAQFRKKLENLILALGQYLNRVRTP